MKTIIKTVNEKGLQEIREFLINNHIKAHNLDDHMLRIWGNFVNLNLSEDNNASIEIKSERSIHGRTQTYTISEAGLDCKEVEING